MKIAHYNKTDGQLLGWYDEEIHAEIPVPNIEVTEEQWSKALENGHNHVTIDGVTSAKDFRTASDKIAEKVSEYMGYLGRTDFKMLADYPKDVTEVIKLRKEARDYIYENEVPNEYN